eukprot:1114779-Rhodomonas_salina.1
MRAKVFAALGGHLRYALYDAECVVIATEKQNDIFGDCEKRCLFFCGKSACELATALRQGADTALPGILKAHVGIRIVTWEICRSGHSVSAMFCKFANHASYYYN